MPEGWKGIEHTYSNTSKYAGQVYVRYSSLDGKHKHVGSARKVIEIHCQEHGLDFDDMFEQYKMILQEKKKREAAARGKQIIVKGEQREMAVERFRDRFGELKGPIVYCFEGWTTRWTYQPNCQQVFVTYTDLEGNEWKLLKDLECYFQTKIDENQGEGIAELIEAAKLKADPVQFSEGSRMARASQSTYEVLATGESAVIEKDEMNERKRKREEKLERKAKKRALRMPLDGFADQYIQQQGWSALATREDLELAFTKFPRFLAARGFDPTTELVAVYGLSEGRYASRLRGMYYKIPGKVGGRACYQKLLYVPWVKSGLGCDGLFLMWSLQKHQWQINISAKDGAPVVACCQDPAAEHPADAKGVWRVQEGQQDFHEVALSIERRQ